MNSIFTLIKRKEKERKDERDEIKLKKVFERRLILALVIALLLTSLAKIGWFGDQEYAMADSLYQSTDNVNEDILVIGIDSYAMQELGDWPWDRDIMADVINILNQDEEYKPAAIGIDVMYVTPSDKDYDDYLIEACKADNIVLTGGVEFGTAKVTDDDGNSYLDDKAVSAYNFPFEDIRDVCDMGHGNAMLDKDGILRHHLWSVPDENGEEVLSLPKMVYDKYCDYNGITEKFTPKIANDGFWWVDYSGEIDDFYAYSVADIIYGDYDPEIIKGSIVLIGPYEAGLTDNYFTPVDHAEKMYGVEYLANVTNALVRGVDKTEIPYNIQLVVIFLMAFFSTLYFTTKSLRETWAISLVLFAVSVFGCIGLYRYADIVFLPLWPPVVMVIAFIASIIEHYIVARAERRHITNTFKHYVDPKIIKELLKGGEESLNLGGRTVNIAVLFVDIRGFTTMSEKLHPEQVVEVLNEYLTLTSDCVKNNGGTLDKFVGDCTMAFWGAPIDCPNPVHLATRAAMDMVEGSKPLEKILMEKYGRTVSFGVGVHYGPAVVGNIGAVDRMDYTAIGDTVNTSARLEANAPKGKVYISRIVADMLGDSCTTTSLGDTVKLKGKEEGFEVLILESLEEKNKGEFSVSL